MLKLFKQDDTDNFQKELLKPNINTKKLEKLIHNGANFHKLDDKGQTFLFPLVRKRETQAIKLLIKHGIKVNHEDNFGKTVLNEAIERGDSLMIRFLLENCHLIDHINFSGRTVIQDVALDGNYRIFKILMEYNPNLNIKDTYGRTVLFDAVEGENLKIIREVLKKVDNPNEVDEHGQTVLFNAVLKANSNIAIFLVMNKLDINIIDENGENILFSALLMGDSNINLIELLLKEGINLNIKNIRNETIVDEILTIVRILKNPKKKFEKKYKLVDEKKDYLKLTSILIENGLLINEVDFNGKTVLYKEIEQENYDIANFLLASGVSINYEDEEGKTILFKAIMGGMKNIKIIEYLISKGADIDHKNILEKNIVDELCEIILIQQNNKKPISRKYLGIDYEENYLELLKKIITYKPKLNEPRLDGRTTIFDIIIYNNLPLLKLLCNSGMNTNIIDKQKNTPLSILVDNGLTIKKIKERDAFLERLVFLLKFRIDLNVTDSEGRTVYHRAVMADDLEVVEKLLSKKGDLNIKDNQGRTALHHTQWKGNFKIARLLIAAGADMNAVDYAGFTLLNYATILGHTNLVMVLIASRVLMYNHSKKNRSVAQFFKEREKNFEKLLSSNITDLKMVNAIKQVISNLKSEIDDALK